MSERFLSRWSKLKREARESELDSGQANSSTDTEIPVPGNVAKPAAAVDEVSASSLQTSDQLNVEKRENLAEAPELPTEADLDKVGEESGMKAFLNPEVSEELRNKAFKALFSLPGVSVVDGLDVYMENFNTFTPLGADTISKMALAKQLLKSHTDEPNPEEAPKLETPEENSETLEREPEAEETNVQDEGIVSEADSSEDGSICPESSQADTDKMSHVANAQFDSDSKSLKKREE